LDLLEYSYLASPALAANPLAVVRGIKSTSLLEESFEDLQDDLKEAAAATLGLDEMAVMVVATFADHVVVCCMPGAKPASLPTNDYDADEPTYWELPYTLDKDGEPVVGDPKPVEQAYVDAKWLAKAEW